MNIDTIYYEYTETKFNRFSKQLDELFCETYGNLNEADIFKILNQYQSKRLDNIEKVANKTKDAAIQRTLLYLSHEVLEKYKKSKSEKNKEKMVFKLVNNLVLYISDVKYIDYSLEIRETFDIILKHKEKILQSEDWYLRVIPESKWLLEHLKTLGD